MADAVATLGLAVDATGALVELEKFDQATKRTGATATKAAEQVSAITTRSERMAQATRLTNADITASTKRFEDMIATMKRVDEVQKRVTDSSQAIGRAHADAIRMNEQLDGAAKKVADGLLNKLRPGFASLATQMTHTNAATGVLAGTIGQFAIGGGATVAILAGVAAMGAAYEALTEKTRKQREEQDKATKSLLDFAKASRDGIGGKLREEIDATTAALERSRKLQQIAKTGSGNFEGLGVAELFGAAFRRSGDYEKEQKLLQDAITRGEGELRKIFQESSLKNDSQRSQDLASLVASNRATIAERQEAVRRVAALNQLVGQLTKFSAESPENANATRQQRLQAIADSKALGDALEGEVEKVQKKTMSLKELHAWAVKVAEAERNNDRNKEFAQTGVNAVAQLDARIKKTQEITQEEAKQYLQNEERLAQLRADVDLIGKSGEEREALIDAENRRLALAQKMTDAQADEFVALERAKRNAEEFGSTLQTVLGIAQLLAVAFGDVGKEIAKAASGAQSIVSGVGSFQKATSFADKAGAAGTIAGGAFVLLDALQSLDKSQQRNAERANALTKAFEEQISAAADLTTITTETAAGIAATVATLQASAIAAFQAQVIAARGNGAAIREATTGLGDALKEIERLEKARTKALEEQARALQSFSANNDVLRLRLQGRDNEADTAQTVIDIEEKVAAAVAKFGNTVEVAEYRLLLLAQAAKDAAEAEEERQREADRRAEEERRSIFDLQNGALAFTNPRAAGQAAFDESLVRRWNDAVARGASQAELAAIALYNVAAAADYAAQLIEQDTRTTEGLIARILSASGDARGAEDASFAARQRQEMADAIRSGMSESNLALLRFTQFAERSQLQMQRAIEDGTKAIQEQAKLQIAAIDDMIEAIQTVSAREIKALDEQIEATQIAAKATAKAFDLQIAAIREQTKAQIAAIDAQIDSARDALDAAQKQLSVLEKSVQTNRQVVDALTQFRDSLKLGGLSTLSPEQKLAEARAQFERTSAAAQGGDSAAALRLPAAAQALLEASRAFNASGPGFVADYNRVQAVVDAVERQFGATLPLQEQQLEAARQAVESLQQTIESLGEQKQAIQDSAEAQIEAIQKAKDKAAEDAQTVIDRLTEQRDNIRDNAQKQIDKLNETKDAINLAAQRQIDELVKIETAAHLTRLRQDEYWSTFLGLTNPNGGSGGDSRDRLRTGPRTAATSRPVQVAEDQLAEARTQNRQVEQTNTRLAQVESLVIQLIDVIVAQSQQQATETQQIVTAVDGVGAETRNTGQALALRR